MAINPISIPYSDFRFDEIINPEAFDLNNEALRAKIEELITAVNLMTSKGLTGDGQRIETCPMLFFTNGGSNKSTASFTFATAFASAPTILATAVGSSVPYSNVLLMPFVSNVTATGFTATLQTANGNLGTVGTPANLGYVFVAIGK